MIEIAAFCCTLCALHLCQTCHNKEVDPRKDTPGFRRKNAIEGKLRILEESLAKKEKT